MTQSMNKLRKALYSRLSSQITATPTYSYVPPDAGFPYIRIGEIYAQDAGTKTNNIFQYEVTLHLFDKGANSTATIDALVKSVVDALHWYNLSVEDHTTVTCRMVNQMVMQQGEISDYYWHAVVRFAITLEAQ